MEVVIEKKRGREVEEDGVYVKVDLEQVVVVDGYGVVVIEKVYVGGEEDVEKVDVKRVKIGEVVSFMDVEVKKIVGSVSIEMVVVVKEGKWICIVGRMVE